ncbi:MAG TPA: uroporphyrinogen-III synthase [Nevskiaceae bacterium]|nr:uroporphyrinogen-III synthase [Nevskiaceae bacterium]
MLAPDLGGAGVLVTRPVHQARGLCQAVSAAGGRPVTLPLLAVAGPLDADATRAALVSALGDGLWLFTSPNAVRWTAQLAAAKPAAWPRQLAVAGHGTAAALAGLGRTDALCPAIDGAEGLLSLPVLDSLPGGATVTVLCGARSPPRLADGLRRRGLQPRLIDVYRRVPVPHTAAEMAAALEAVVAAIVTSGEGLQQLHALTPAALQTRLMALQLAVPSTRVVEMARRLGFQQLPLLPSRVGDEAFVQALLEWRTKQGKHAPR